MIDPSGKIIARNFVRRTIVGKISGVTFEKIRLFKLWKRFGLEHMTPDAVILHLGSRVFSKLIGKILDLAI